MLPKIAATSPVVQWSHERQSHPTTSLNSDYNTGMNMAALANIQWGIFIQEMGSSIVLKLEI